MPRFQRLALPLLCTWLTACSLVTDFDRSKIDPGTSDGGMGDGDGDGDGDMDGGNTRPDGGRDSGVSADAGHDSGVPGPDAGGGCRVNQECGDEQLCCNGTCVDTSLGQCSECGQGCGDFGASSCSARECKCGDSPQCAAGGDKPFCSGAVGSESCSECRSDEDCDDNAAGEFCVSGACVKCDRGPNAASAADDRGCSGATPICGTNNTCTGCSNSPNNCPNGLDCVVGQGCFGCDPDAAIGSNQCGSTTPVCKLSGTMSSCEACTNNTSCKGAYCDEGAGGGGCYTACDPDTHQGCTNINQPRCLVSGASASCVACNAPGAPACANGTFCKTSADRVGQCVSCRDNNDCDDASKPICDTGTRTCRGCDTSSETSDCPSSAFPACNEATGRCVPCRTGGTHTACGAADACFNFGCVDCNSDGAPECPSAASPVCANHECVPCAAGKVAACTGGTVCTGTPTCTNNACVYPPLDVDDDKSCTTDSCTVPGGVSHEDTCTQDDNDCTRPSTCGASGCSAQVADDDLCTAAGLGQCTNVGSGKFECHECDPANDDGCNKTTENCNSTTYECELLPSPDAGTQE
jgi:hypothetical protein